MSGIGDNSLIVSSLKSMVERIERLAGEKQNIADDIKEVFAEAKANGLDTKVLRKIVALRKRDKNDVQEEQSMIALYANALGMTWME